VRNGAYIESIKDKAEELGGQPGKELRGAVDGFSARLTEEDVTVLEADPNVEYVEPDEVVRIDGAVSGYVDCNASSMSASDDGSIGPVDVGFSVNWFGTSYSSIYINNNGGFVFNDGGGDFTSYRGVDLQTATRPYVLPLFTDIDTRYTDGVVTFGPLDNANPSAGFCINWVDVGEYQGTEEDYSFQVIMTNLGGGQIDLEFNYDRVSVPTNSSNQTFEVGYTAGNASDYLVLADSTEASATVANRLVANKFPASCTVAGRYIYEIRSSGTPTPGPTPTTEPITPDPTPSPTQTPATWGLDRIDQTALPLNNTYITPTSSTASDNYGQGVVVYVVDTGVRYTHQEFGNRARKNESIKGIDEVNNDTDPNDCNGHGTHVAGTIGGFTYGVAKLAEIVGVRVLDCFGSGYTSDVVAGLNAIPAFHAARYGAGYRAVVNMSLGGGKSVSLNEAVKALADAHIPVVVAAGNDNADAVNYSPASEATAITVGASTNLDARASYSNYGPSVDIFAPGSSITAPWYTSDTAIYTASGTSMASPHVAGAVALYLGLNSTSSSSPSNTQIASAITSKATVNALNLNSPPTSTVNKLLYVSTYATPLGVYTSPRMASLPPVSEDLDAPSEIVSTRLPRSLIETRCTGRDSGGSPSTPPSSSPPSGGGGGGGGGGGSSSPEPSGGGGAALEDEITVTQPPLVTNQVSGNGEFKIIDAAGNPVQLSAAGLTPNGLVVRGSGWQVESSGPLTANNTTLQPGQSITIRGSGLQRLTTAGVYILSKPTWVAAGIVSYENEFSTSFLVPALAPGQHTLQINTVRQGQAPVSIAVGFTLAGETVSTSSSSSSSTSASATKPAAANTKSLFVSFANKSAVLSATAKKRISSALTSLGAVAPTISLTGFSTNSASPASVKLAASRMRAINAYVKAIGFGQQVSFVPAKAARTPQAKGVLIRATS
jgi:subtilisin family serine protease